MPCWRILSPILPLFCAFGCAPEPPPAPAAPAQATSGANSPSAAEATPTGDAVAAAEELRRASVTPALAVEAPSDTSRSTAVLLVLGSDGAPAVGAEIRHGPTGFKSFPVRHAFGNANSDAVLAWDGRPEWPTGSATTADDGRARLTGLPPNQRFVAEVRAPDRTTHLLHHLAPGPGEELELPPVRLLPGRDVLLRFEDDAGAPIAGLEFRCSAPQPIAPDFPPGERDVHLRWLEAEIAYDGPDDEHHAVTTADGTVLLRGLPLHPCGIAVWDPRFRRDPQQHFLTLPATVREHVVVLARGAVLTGRIVQQDGTPVRDAELSLAESWAFHGDEEEGAISTSFHSSHPSFTPRSEIRSDAEGRFTLPSGAGDGDFVIVQAQLPPNLHFAFPMTRQRSGLTLVIPNLIEVRGRFTGLPDPAMCRVAFHSGGATWADEASGGAAPQCDFAVDGEGFAVDADGSFRARVPIGSYWAWIQAPGLRHEFLRNRAFNASTDLGELGIPAGSPLEVRLVIAGLEMDAWKELLVRHEVWNEEEAEWKHSRELASPDASEPAVLTWPKHSAGRFRITLEIPGFEAAGTEYHVTDSGERKIESLVMRPCGSAVVRVTNLAEAGVDPPLVLELVPDEATAAAPAFEFQRRLWWSAHDEHQTPIGADGAALFENLCAGRWRIRALPGDGESSFLYPDPPWLGSVEIVAGAMAEAAVCVEGFGVLQILVTDGRGAPVRGTLTSLQSEAQMKHGDPTRRLDSLFEDPAEHRFTTAEGRAHYPRVPFGRYAVCARRDEHSAASWTRVDFQPGSAPFALTLDGAEVSIRAFHADGSLPTDGRLSLVSMATSESWGPPLAGRMASYEHLLHGAVATVVLEDVTQPIRFQSVPAGIYRVALYVWESFDPIGIGWSAPFEVPAEGEVAVEVRAETTPVLNWQWNGTPAWDGRDAVVAFRREGDEREWEEFPLWEDEDPQELELPLPAGTWTAVLRTPDGAEHAHFAAFRHGPGAAPPPPWTLPPPPR